MSNTPEADLYEVNIEAYGIPLTGRADAEDIEAIGKRALHLVELAPDSFYFSNTTNSLMVKGFTPADQEFYDLYHWVRGSQDPAKRFLSDHASS
jgi:hypothetical protein